MIEMQEKITLGGRPQKIGRYYAEYDEQQGRDVLKITVGYCKHGHKVGLTREQMAELAVWLPGPLRFFLYRLWQTRIVIPR